MINEHWCFEYFCATFALLFVIDGDGDAVCDGGNDISVPLLTAGAQDGPTHDTPASHVSLSTLIILIIQM